MSYETVYARIDEELAKALNADVERRIKAAGGAKITRSDVVRIALERHVKEAARPRKKGDE